MKTAFLFIAILSLSVCPFLLGQSLKESEMTKKYHLNHCEISAHSSCCYDTNSQESKDDTARFLNEYGYGKK